MKFYKDEATDTLIVVDGEIAAEFTYSIVTGDKDYQADIEEMGINTFATETLTFITNKYPNMEEIV